jgi:hypothetical protein
VAIAPMMAAVGIERAVKSGMMWRVSAENML